MIDLRLTTREAIELHSELDLLQICFNPNTPPEIKAKLAGRNLSPLLAGISEKLKAELDNLVQAQRLVDGSAVAEIARSIYGSMEESDRETNANATTNTNSRFERCDGKNYIVINQTIDWSSGKTTSTIVVTQEKFEEMFEEMISNYHLTLCALDGLEARRIVQGGGVAND